MIIQEERDKQQRQRAKDLEQEVEYVDSARNISVVLDSGDLSEDFESHGIDSGKRDKCGPNSKMLHRLAKYYAGKKETNLAMAALEEAQSLVVEEKDKDFSLQVTEARLNLETGNYLQALKSAEIVLWQPEYKKSLTALYVKAQSLFNLCDFERALITFHKGIHTFLLLVN